MLETGQVVKQKNNLVTVRFSRKSTCEHCNMCAFKPNDSHVDITMENTVGCKVGDSVEVNITDSTVLKLSVLVYFLPLFVGLVGFLISYLLEASEIVQLIVFVASLGLGFLSLAVIDKFYRISKKGKPEIIRVVSNTDFSEEG